VLACSKDPATRESRIMRRIHVGAQDVFISGRETRGLGRGE
jgi:hypothetical protein